MKKAAHPTPHKPKPKPKLPKVQHVKHEEDEPPFKILPEPVAGPKPKLEPKPVDKPKPEPPPDPEPKPQAKAKAYTQEDWEKEVAQHVQPGRPIPDWLAAKAP